MKKLKLIKALFTTPVILLPVTLSACSSAHDKIFKQNNTSKMVDSLKKMVSDAKQSGDLTKFWTDHFDSALNLAVSMYYGFIVGKDTSFQTYSTLNTAVATKITRNKSFFVGPQYNDDQKKEFQHQITSSLAIYALINLATAYSYIDYFDQTKKAAAVIYSPDGYDPTKKPSSNDPISTLLYVLANTSKLNVASQLVNYSNPAAKSNITTNLISTGYAKQMYGYVNGYFQQYNEIINPLYIFETNSYKYPLDLEINNLNSSQGVASAKPWKYDVNFSIMNTSWKITSLSQNANSKVMLQSDSFSTIKSLPSFNKIQLNPKTQAISTEFYQNYSLWASKQAASKATMQDYLADPSLTDPIIKQLLDSYLATAPALSSVTTTRDLVNKLVDSQNTFNSASSAWKAQENIYINDIAADLRNFLLNVIVISSLYLSENQTTVNAIKADGTVSANSTWGSFLNYLNTSSTSANYSGNYFAASESKKISLVMKNFFQDNNSVDPTDKTLLLMLSPLADISKITLAPITNDKTVPVSGSTPWDYQIKLECAGSSEYTFDLNMLCQFSSSLQRATFNNINYYPKP